MKNTSPQNDIAPGWLLWGLFFGLLTGAVAALFAAPRRGAETRQQLTQGGQQLYEKIEATVTPTDPIAQSLAEGKAAAQRRRAELGLEN